MRKTRFFERAAWNAKEAGGAGERALARVQNDGVCGVRLGGWIGVRSGRRVGLAFVCGRVRQRVVSRVWLGGWALTRVA